MEVKSDKTFNKAMTVILWMAVIVFILPVATILITPLFPNQEVWQHLISTVFSEYLWNTVILLLGVGVLSSFLGVGSAWLVSTFSFPARRFFSIALLMPLSIPTYIFAYSCTSFFDYGGILSSLLSPISADLASSLAGLPIRSLPGAIIVLSLALYPYIYLASRTALSYQNPGLQEAALSMGSSYFGYFIKISWRLIRPAYIAGLSFALIETASEFGAVQHFGVQTFVTGIYRTWFGLNESLAAAQLAAGFMILIVSIMAMERFFRNCKKYEQYSVYFPQRLAKCSPGTGKAVTFTLTLLFGASFLMPISSLVFGVIVSWEDTIWQDIFTLASQTFTFALIATFIVVAISFLFLSWGRFKRAKLVTTFTKLAGACYSLPGVVLAVGLLLPLIQIDKFLFDLFDRYYPALFLSGGYIIIILAYVVRFSFIGIETIQAGYQSLHKNLEEMALSLGAGFHNVFSKIQYPLLKPQISAASILVFIEVIKELPATLVLRPFNVNTLAIKTYELASDEMLMQASVPAMVIIIVGIPAVYLLHLRSKK